MKYIFLGIKDYCKDCWHDWLLAHMNKCEYCTVYTDSYHGNNKNKIDHNKVKDFYRKEGSVWHYIQQRRVKKLLEEIKQLQKEVKKGGKQ